MKGKGKWEDKCDGIKWKPSAEALVLSLRRRRIRRCKQCKQTRDHLLRKRVGQSREIIPPDNLAVRRMLPFFRTLGRASPHARLESLISQQCFNAFGDSGSEETRVRMSTSLVQPMFLSLNLRQSFASRLLTLITVRLCLEDR